MNSTIRFPFTPSTLPPRRGSWLPYVPISLRAGVRVLQSYAMLDTGSALNVLPFDIGLQLGLQWDENKAPLELTGNLANSAAQPLLLICEIKPFPPLELIFAWSRNNVIPIILGQNNFFMNFDVLFSRARDFFEIAPKLVEPI